MTLSTIAVHLDHTERCETRTVLAARLARLHGGHLVGIVTTGVQPDEAPASTHTEMADCIVGASLYLRRRAESVAHVFRCRIAELTPPSFDARLVDGEPVDAVVDHGRTSDLIIVGQADERATVDAAVRQLPEEVMLHAGRPVLIVPRAGRFDAALDRVLVAWDGSREASMSLRGALPLLRKAAKVSLISLLRGGDANAGRTLCPAEMIAWLSRHGVQAGIEQRLTAMHFADALLDHATTMQSDLLVMGGYGHACARERMLGGVTRDVLARAAIPVFMAH
ncbi:universal stress protein [Variovorax sp. VaC1]|uniref:universal stress protein n=1 Tax=Variovorax sp. VaC1 TaxID=3373132 RepID=UPI003748C7E3